jgi:outer membrane receptor protein involved in Fe transport
MKKRALASSILVALCAALPIRPVFAQSADTQSSQAQTDQDKKKDENAQKLETVTVTGSLIPRSQIETASPVITISSDQLRTQGFRDIYDALKTSPVATGYTQDNQVVTFGSFTPGATTISLFGLSPSFTLILLNGHPIADYPSPYNGVENVTDLSNIPIEAVDHIDILSGAQSSLYGSSAIAGVVNIFLKQKKEGIDFSFRGGGYDNGGGANERAQFSGGTTRGNFSATYSLSLENQDPVRLRQSFFPSRLSNPLGVAAGRDFLQFEPFPPNAYFDPGAHTCDQSSNLFGDTLQYSSRPGGRYFCGSLYDYANATILNGKKSADGYLNLTYQLSTNTQAYGEVLYGFSKQLINTGPAFWSFFNQELKQSANSLRGVFWDNTKQDFESIQRFFAPEELGGVDANDTSILTRQYNANIGLRGNLGSSDWSYDVYYNRSQINTASSMNEWPLTDPLNEYYLGAQQGEDPYGYGFPAYTPNLQNFYKPLTPAQIAAMSDPVQSRSLSWQQNVHATITNTDLFELPAGAAGFAGIVEFGNQAFNNPVDPRVINGDFNNLTGTQGAGSRKRFAIGAELQMPVFDKLTADVSARYDSYKFAGRTDSKPTYKLGLEYRPIDTLLLRTNYATAFRAPDLLYIFQGQSGLYSSGTDYYLCRLQGYDASNLSSCPQAPEGLFSFYHGSPDLKSITAKSYGFGTVWSPSPKFDLKVDYTHIAIDNEVLVQSSDSILQTEADCRLGTSLGGQAYDINSALCQSTLAQVTRYPADYPFVLAQNQVQYLSRYPINIANEYLSGIQASSTYRMDFGHYGNVALSAQYYVELKHKLRQQPGDPYIDLLHDFNSYEFKSRSSASVSWAVGNWTSTLYGTLYGKNSNYLGTGLVGQWAQFNGSVQYDFGDKNSVLFTVNNIGNRAPPTDTSVGPGSQYPPPYYNGYVYNGYGRIYWLEYHFHF